MPLLNGYSHLEKLDKLFGANRVLGGVAHLQGGSVLEIRMGLIL
ncbi:MAG: hypothetical protein ACREYF_09335 [Gammaproteobacteria bacterium]